MDSHDINPALERLRIDEVLHLHNLWRLGPPRNPNPNPHLRHHPNALSLKQDKRFKKRGERKERPSDHPEVEWPCPPPPIPWDPDAGWGEAKKRKPVEPRAPPSEADRAQHEGLIACKDFLSNNYTSDDDDDEGDEMEEDEREAKAFEFFLGLFERDAKLRGYYEKSWENGEFSCMVCNGIGVKAWKRFCCVGLVQHSMTIAKTSRREAHRALARVVCRVLGWDIDRFPSIVLDTGLSLGESLAGASNQQKGDPSDKKVDTLKEASGNVAKCGKALMLCIEDRNIEALQMGEGVINDKEELHKDIIESMGADCGNPADYTQDMEISSSPDVLTRRKEEIPQEAGAQLAIDTPSMEVRVDCN